MNRGLDLLINFYDFLMVLSLMIKVVVVAISIIFGSSDKCVLLSTNRRTRNGSIEIKEYIASYRFEKEWNMEDCFVERLITFVFMKILSFPPKKCMAYTIIPP